MKNEIARREIESLDYYLQNHTNDYSEESHTAMMMAIKALEQQPCEDTISRQAALNSLIDNTHLDGYDLAEALDAIENKEKLPPVTQIPIECDDAISRKAVLEPYQTLDDSDTISVWLLRKNIEQQPPVTPQQKYGKWIEHPEIETSTPEYLMFYECSECGDKQCFCKSDIHKKRFCSNCGEKMVEPQERSEDKE